MKKKKIVTSIFICFLALFALSFSVTAADDYILSENELYGYVILDDGTAEIIGYAGDAENFVVPAEIDGYKISSIGPKAFYDNDSFVTVTIPDGITKISEEAFDDCNSLIEVVIGDDVLSIGDFAFNYCDRLQSVKLGENVSSIGVGVFRNCFNLESFEFNSKITKIADGTFFDCYALKSVDLGGQVTEIGYRAFCGCPFLKTVTGAENVKIIGEEAFLECFSLKNISFGKNVESVGQLAFSFCASLDEFPFGEKTESIEMGAFAYCYSLADEVRIYKDIKTIGESAFAFSFPVTNVYIYNDNIEISDSLIGYSDVSIDELNSEFIEKYAEYQACVYMSYCGLETDDYYEELAAEIYSEYIEPYLADNNFDELEEGQPYSVIHCYKDSTAEAYAISNGFKYVLFECYEASETAATCIRKGSTVYTCTCGCGDTYSIENDYNKTNHEGGTVTVNKVEVSCDADGYSGDIYCGGCDAMISKGEAIVSPGHNPVDITTDPTCTADGVKITSCINCGNMLGIEVLPSAGHNKVAENNDDGTHRVFCKVSGCQYSETELCTYGQWNIVKYSSCTENGLQERFCTVCSYKMSQEILAEGHSMQEWIITEYPTMLKDGSKTRECLNCEYSETIGIERLAANETKDEKTGINMIFTDNAYNDKNVEIRVENDYTGTQYILQSLGTEYIGYISYNIKTYVDGEEVQPSEPVLIRIPLPSNFNPDKLAVYHTNTKTNVFERITPIYVEDGYVVFYATSFSIYTVVDTGTAITVTPEIPEENPADKCSCNCHKSGFMGFIWKILRFFYKLFGTNKICACGAEHY